jgi:hypothetical protein
MSRSKQSSETAARLARLFSPHVAFRVLALLTGFPPDAMWKAAFTVAWRVGVCGLLGQRQRFHDCLPDSARAPKIRDLL